MSRIVKVGKTGTDTQNVTICDDDVFTYADLFRKAGISIPSGSKLKSSIGAVNPSDVVDPDVTVVVIGAPKIDGGF